MNLRGGVEGELNLRGGVEGELNFRDGAGWGNELMW